MLTKEQHQLIYLKRKLRKENKILGMYRTGNEGMHGKDCKKFPERVIFGDKWKAEDRRCRACREYDRQQEINRR